MHAYLGRFRAGATVTIPLVTVAADGTAAEPAAPPQARIVPLGPGAPGYFIVVPMVLIQSPDVFEARFPLLSSTPPYGVLPKGRYTVRLSWTSGGVDYVQTATFDVTSGGDAGGGVIALHEVRRAPRRAVVAQLQSGVLAMGNNPKIERVS